MPTPTVTPPTSSAPSAGGNLPSVVKVRVDELKIPVAEPTKEYHVGTRDGCPSQNVSLAGISFPRFTGGAAVGDPQRRGARVHLTPSQIEAIKDAVSTKVCRWRKLPSGGGQPHGIVMSTNALTYRAQAGDEPLAKYVYCVELAPEVARAIDSEPEAMA